MAVFGGSELSLAAYDQHREDRLQPPDLESGIFDLLFKFRTGQIERAAKLPADVHEAKIVAGGLVRVHFDVIDMDTTNQVELREDFDDGIWKPSRGLRTGYIPVAEGYFRSSTGNTPGDRLALVSEKELEEDLRKLNEQQEKELVPVTVRR